MRSPRTFLLSAALLFAAAGAHAQHAAGSSYGSLQFVVGVPQNAFYDRVETVGFGLTGQYLYHLGRAPVAFGIEGGFLVYDQERFSECLATCRVRVDVVTSNNIALGHLVLRLQPARGTVRPYADALAGVTYLFTESRLEDEDFGDDREIASSTNFDDAAFSYGLGGGVMAEVYQGRSKTGRPYEILIDARVRYLLGGEAKYLRGGDLGDDGRPLRFSESRTDLLLPQLGVTFRF